MPASGVLEIRGNLKTTYADVFTPEAMSALHALAPLDADRKNLMAARIARRADSPSLWPPGVFSGPRPWSRSTSCGILAAEARWRVRWPTSRGGTPN